MVHRWAGNGCDASLQQSGPVCCETSFRGISQDESGERNEAGNADVTAGGDDDDRHDQVAGVDKADAMGGQGCHNTNNGREDSNESSIADEHSLTLTWQSRHASNNSGCDAGELEIDEGENGDGNDDDDDDDNGDDNDDDNDECTYSASIYSHSPTSHYQAMSVAREAEHWNIRHQEQVAERTHRILHGLPDRSVMDIQQSEMDGGLGA